MAKEKTRLQIRRRAYMVALYKLRDRNRRDFDELLDECDGILWEQELTRRENLAKQQNLRI